MWGNMSYLRTSSSSPRLGKDSALVWSSVALAGGTLVLGMGLTLKASVLEVTGALRRGSKHF